MFIDLETSKMLVAFKYPLRGMHSGLRMTASDASGHAVVQAAEVVYHWSSGCMMIHARTTCRR